MNWILFHLQMDAGWKVKKKTTQNSLAKVTRSGSMWVSGGFHFNSREGVALSCLWLLGAVRGDGRHWISPTFLAHWPLLTAKQNTVQHKSSCLLLLLPRSFVLRYLSALLRRPSSSASCPPLIPPSFFSSGKPPAVPSIPLSALFVISD